MVSGRLSSARAAPTSRSPNRARWDATIIQTIRIEETVLTSHVTPFVNASLNGAFAGINHIVQTFPTWTCALITNGTGAHAPIPVKDDVKGLTLASVFPGLNGLMGRGTALTKVMKLRGRSIARRRGSSSKERREKEREGRMNNQKPGTKEK